MKTLITVLYVTLAIASVMMAYVADAQVAHVRQPDGTWVKVVPSPDNTILLAGSPNFILDASNNTWTLTLQGLVYVNGAQDMTSYAVQELAYEKGVIWQFNGKDWYSKNVPLWSSPTLISPVPGTAQLSWTIPTTNLDGTPLTDLGGFLVSYGTSPTNLTQTVALPNTATSYQVLNLGVGTWYFEIAAVTTQGLQGAESIEASKTIQ